MNFDLPVKGKKKLNLSIYQIIAEPEETESEKAERPKKESMKRKKDLEWSSAESVEGDEGAKEMKKEKKSPTNYDPEFSQPMPDDFE
jgi:hypothetical protein